jgi:hypothetical protein
VRLKEVVAAIVPQDPGAHGVLEALEELEDENGRFMEPEIRGERGGIGVTLTFDPLFDSLEEAVDHAEVEMRVQRRAEAAQETDGPKEAEAGAVWQASLRVA